MKTKWMILQAIACMLPVLALGQSSYYEDDLYYSPKNANTENISERETTKKAVKNRQDESVQIYDNSGSLESYDLRNVDEYNRHTPVYETEGEVETVEAPQNEIDTIYGDENQPFEYSERVRRFHNPDFTTHITDDEYLNIYVEDGADVDIYYMNNDRSYGWMSPYFYDSYYYPRYGYRGGRFYNPYRFYYDPWSYSSWGYYDPWYAGSWGWDPWYGGGYYGYGYYNDGWGGYYNYGGYGGNYSQNSHHLNADQRRFLSTNRSGRSAASRTTRAAGTNAVRSTSSTNGVSTRSTSAVGTRSSSVTTTRSSSGATTRASSGATTRASSGATTRSTSSSTRPSSSSNARTSPSTTTRSSVETSTRTYKSGSSASSTRSTPTTSESRRSSYTPSSSSYTPSSSSSSSGRSSSSSSSSGGSSSRSSSGGSGRR